MTPDPIQTARLATLLRENAPIYATTGDTAFAATCASVATALELLLALASLPVPMSSPPQLPAPRPPRLSRHKQAQIATTWFFDRREAFKGKTPPSEARDIEDAGDPITGIPGVSRDVIRKHRPIEWRVGRDKKPKSPSS